MLAASQINTTTTMFTVYSLLTVFQDLKSVNFSKVKNIPHLMVHLQSTHQQMSHCLFHHCLRLFQIGCQIYPNFLQTFDVEGKHILLQPLLKLGIAFLKFSSKNRLNVALFKNARTGHLKFKQRFHFFILPPFFVVYVSENEKN